MEKTNAYIVGTGSYLPGKPIPFDKVQSILGGLDQLPKKVKKWFDKNNDIMKELLGVKYYHYAIDPDTKEYIDDNITMSVKAANKALNISGINANEIDFIAYGSNALEQMPTTSVLIQDALGINECAEMSIHANCTSAYKALMVATEFIESGRYENALVISSNITSGLMTSEYYNMDIVTKENILLRWFLCDGAGALVLSSKKLNGAYFKIKSNYIESIGGNRDPMMFNNRPAHPVPPNIQYEKGMHHLSQRFRKALSSEAFVDSNRKKSLVYCGLERMLMKYPVNLDMLGFLQINLPSKQVVLALVDELKELNIDTSKLYSNLEDVGYSGPPAVFICLDNIFREKSPKDGELIISFVTEVSKFMQAGFVLESGGRIKEMKVA